MPKQVVATHRKARHEYHILDTYEAGLVLTGTEVKALREHKVSLTEGYARFEGADLYMLSMNIGEYSHAGNAGHLGTRPRKLLLHRRELSKLRKAVDIKGQTLIPLSLYFRSGWAKVELAVVKGKQHRDKRRDIADREAKRQLDRLHKARRTP